MCSMPRTGTEDRVADLIDDRLRKVLVEQLKYPLSASEIVEHTSLYGKGLGLDSLDVVSLIVRVEDEFDIVVEAEEVADIVKTFGTLRDAVHRKLEAA